MLRASSPSPLQISKESQPDTPCPKLKLLNDLERCSSPVQRFVSTPDLDGCSTVAPSPMTVMHPSPWDTPWQAFTSPDGRTSQDCPPPSPRKRATAVSLNFGLGASIRAMGYDVWSTANQSPPWPHAALATPPSPLTEAAWLEVLDACLPASVPRALPSEMPPETPRKSTILRQNSLNTAPGAPKKIRTEETQLWQALQSDSVSDARKAVADDPDAAWTPFWECNWEPPLCRAARRISDPAIVILLLEHRADVNAVDQDGQTPLALLNAAAAVCPCFELLPRRLALPTSTLNTQPVESLGAVSSSRAERVRQITSILIHAGAIMGVTDADRGHHDRKVS